MSCPDRRDVRAALASVTTDSLPRPSRRIRRLDGSRGAGRTQRPAPSSLTAARMDVLAGWVLLVPFHPSGAFAEGDEEARSGMPDEQDVQPDIEPVPDLSTEIGTSLASVWARYFGSRPSKAETEFDGKVVRWVLADGTSEFELGMSAESEDDDDAPAPTRTERGYKRDTSAA